MSIAAQCPNCGASIAFHVSSSLVTVCEHCSTAVARTDRGLHDMGKSADLHRTQSPLSLWLGGGYQGVGFQLTGHVQLLHGAGGVWDEWYLAFDDGRWGWLAEAQGRFYLSFREPEPPVFGAQSLVPGARLDIGNPPVSMVVAETGEAQLMAGRGEIPYYFRPGQRYGYVDLSGAGGAFGTLDFSEETPVLYLGREVSLDELGIAGSAPAQEAMPGMGGPGASVQAVTCDNCGGSLELQAPDKTERVACPYCGAMHDCNHGVLQLLKVLDVPKVTPALPLGAKGSFEGETFTLIGFMRRRTGGDAYSWDYTWDEYLLYHPRLGFRWLVYSDFHWTYVRPLSPGDVLAPPPDSLHDSGEIASYDGKTYKIFQSGTAEVDYVAGEFYWKVEAGETTTTVDYVLPPEMLSGEAGNGEIHWSLGTYMTRAEVDACFPDAEPPDDTSTVVAPNQPYRHKAVYKVWGVLFVAAIVAIILAGRMTKERRVFRQSIPLEPTKSRTEPQVYFSEPFALSGKQNLQITATGRAVDNSWMYVQGDLYNVDTGLVVQYDLPIEYYHGYDGGHWSEGSKRTVKYLSAVPAGNYSMRLSVERSDYRRPNQLDIDVLQGVLRTRAWILLFLGISFLPIGIALHHVSFERRRWSSSDYARGIIHSELSGGDD